MTAQKLAALPSQIRCPVPIPDIAGRYITVTTGGRSRTVTVRGGRSERFEKLYAALSAAVGAG